MGRTLPTIVQLIHSEEDSWRSFRRALRKEDQTLFDVLWVYCRRHAQAAAMANREIPFETLLMTMILGLLREMEILRDKIDHPRLDI
jgi:hypothetical protein